MSDLVVAAIAQPIEQPEKFSEFAAQIARLLDEAEAGGATLAVFPEYGSMQLAALFGAAALDPKDSVVRMQALRGDYDALFSGEATRRGLHVLAPSFPEIHAGSAYNVARLHAPNGRSGAQFKQIMTRFEREVWDVKAGSLAGEGVKTFDTALGRIGVAICYDSEFPLIGRAMAEAGAQTLLAPSCTDTPRGYWRVRIGAQARALENQLHVVHAPTVGAAPWSATVDQNRGAAAIYGPPDLGFPDDGVIAIGPMDRPSVTVARLDPAKVNEVRRNGGVLNHLHWAEQAGAPALSAEIVPLR